MSHSKIDHAHPTFRHNDNLSVNAETIIIHIDIYLVIKYCHLNVWHLCKFQRTCIFTVHIVTFVGTYIQKAVVGSRQFKQELCVQFTYLYTCLGEYTAFTELYANQ